MRPKFSMASTPRRMGAGEVAATTRRSVRVSRPTVTAHVTSPREATSFPSTPLKVATEDGEIARPTSSARARRMMQI